MTWAEMAVSSLAAAKKLLSDHPRASASRSYYAAHVALTEQLLKVGYVPPKGRQTQPHAGQSGLIRKKLALSLGAVATKQMTAAFSRLYSRRIDADYNCNVTVDRSTALESIRNSASVLRAFKVGQP
jgi:uncharacterized protein (UPF0332 family)